MKSKVKTLCLVIIAVFITTFASAQQKGDMAVGGNLSLATGDDFTNFGLGAKFQWNALDQLRIEPSVNYFFRKDNIAIWDLSGNIHYLFSVVDDKVIVYPLVGLGIQGIDVDGVDINWDGFNFNSSHSSTDFAFNVGGGIDVMLTDNLVGNFEFKYKISDNNRAIMSLGIAYKF